MSENILKPKDFLVSGKEFKIIWDSEKLCYKTVPVPEDLAQFYNSDAYISHTGGSQTFFDKLYRRARNFNLRKKLRLIERYHKGKGRLMDVGAGTGDFVKYTQDHGWESYGVEPNEQARELAHQKGAPVYSNLKVQQDPVYDVVTLWHVLEHIEDLDGSIRDISIVLKPDGYLMLALPNFKSLDAKHYKSFWAAYDVPRHLWHFSRDSVRKIFQDQGYSLVAVKPMWMDAFYISWLSEKYRRNPLAPIFGFAVGLASNVYGFFLREYSSHIYVLKKADDGS